MLSLKPVKDNIDTKPQASLHSSADVNETRQIVSKLGKSPQKVGASKEQNEWIAYAFARCGMDCVRTFQAESGWVLLRPGNTVNKDGTRDHGLCQMNSRYHKDFIHSPAFKDPYKQLDRCIGIWNDAKSKGRLKTTFYAYSVRNTVGVVRAIPNI